MKKYRIQDDYIVFFNGEKWVYVAEVYDSIYLILDNLLATTEIEYDIEYEEWGKYE